jgi:TnpA family transposase
LSGGDTLYELTLLKKEPKDFGFYETRSEIARLKGLKEVFSSTQKILPELGISNENIKYYASLVGYYSVYKLKRMAPETVTLYLLCFISNRYCKGHDNLVNTFIYLVSQYDANAKKEAKELVYAYNSKAHQHMGDVGQLLRLFIDDAIPGDSHYSDLQKIAYEIMDQDEIRFMADFVGGTRFDETAFKWDLIARANKQFKKNLRPLLRQLEFRSTRKNDPLLVAQGFLKRVVQDGKRINQIHPGKIPMQFIPPHLKKYILQSEKPGNKTMERIVHPDKYEFLIYWLLAKGVQAGNIFVRESLSFKSFEEDLVSPKQWRNKHMLIRKLDVSFLTRPIQNILHQYKQTVEGLYFDVNRRIHNGKNKDIKIVKKGDEITWTLPYNKKEEPPNSPVYEEFQQIELSELLYFVNRKCGFLSAFTHVLDRYVKRSADNERITACFVALGVNHGLNKMADMSDMVFHELYGTANNYIRPETLKNANDLITNAMAGLPIFKYYNIKEDTIHSSSDGQKYETRFHTINSRYSPKYFGLKKGITAYSLVVNHIPVNAKIIGANEHESHYVFDILFNNTSEVDPKIHSVDMHGVNRVNFFLLDAYEYMFAPRYTRVNERTDQLVGFNEAAHYRDFLLKPSRRVKEDLIISDWDKVLRILVSLGIRTSTQSTIIRKLSSYPRVNRTKKALFELDAIVRTIYTLNYIDSPELRHNVQRALNRGESYHKLRKAVFYANFGKFRVKTELEQQIWSECSRLIANAIIFYNAFVLSELMTRFEKAGRHEDAELVRKVSPVAWRHVNLYGTHRFHRSVDTSYIEKTLQTLENERAWISVVRELDN